MKVLRLVSRRTKVFKSQKHVDVMFALNLFEHMRMQVGEMCSLNPPHSLIGLKGRAFDTVTVPSAFMSPCDLYAAASQRGRHGPQRPPCDAGHGYVPRGQHHLGEK